VCKFTEPPSSASSSPENLQLFDPDKDGGTVIRNIVKCVILDKV